MAVCVRARERALYTVQCSNELTPAVLLWGYLLVCGHVYTTALAAAITGFSLDVDMGGKDILSVLELTATTAHIGALSGALIADSFDLNAVGTLGATTATITSLTVLHALYHCTHDTTVEAAPRANTTVMCGLVTPRVRVCVYVLTERLGRCIARY